MTLKRPAAKIPHNNGHLITLSDERSGTMLFKALKTGVVKKKEQSGPFSVVSKTKGKFQLSVKFQAICQLSVKGLVICQLSVNSIQTGPLRATFCKYHGQLCKMEKSKSPKLCHNKALWKLFQKLQDSVRLTLYFPK